MQTNQNNPNTFRHTHNGVDSEMLSLSSVNIEAQPALSAPDNTALTSGGATGLTTPDSFVIANMRTRINEIKARLIALNLVQ